MAWIPPAHSGAGAKLGEAEATLEAFILVGDKPVVEVDAMGDEHPVAHELHKTVGHFRKERRTANHVIGDPGQPGDVDWDRPLRIDLRMPLVDDFMVADFYRADLRDTVAVRPAAGGLDVDHDIVLLGTSQTLTSTSRPLGGNACGLLESLRT